MKSIEQEQFLEVLEELKGNILIVEGKKDEQALRKLFSDMLPWPQPRASIVRINSRPVAEVAQDAASMAEKHKNRRIIVLTDFDRTGRRLAAKIRLLLQSRNIHADYRIRRDVMNLGIKCTEELASLSRSLGSGNARASSRLRKKECDYYGETSANFNKVCGKGLHKGKGNNRKA